MLYILNDGRIALRKDGLVNQSSSNRMLLHVYTYELNMRFVEPILFNLSGYSQNGLKIEKELEEIKYSDLRNSPEDLYLTLFNNVAYKLESLNPLTVIDSIGNKKELTYNESIRFFRV